jgi:transcription antitermination factor NusG
MPRSIIFGTKEQWFALQVRFNCERNVSTHLKRKGFEQFVPAYRVRRRWSDRMKELECPLFPCYVFCRFDPNHRLPILQTPGVVSVVSYGSEPVPIRDEEILHLQTMVNNCRSMTPWPYLRVGQKVRVVGGALHGLEGLLLHLRNDRRIVVSVNLLQRSVAAQIDRESVEPIL